MYQISVEEERFADGELPPFGIISIWFGALFVGVTAVTQIIYQTIQPLWARPLITVLELFLLALIVISTLYLAVNHQFGIKIVAIPLLVNIGTLLIVHTVAFDRMWENARFSSMSYGLMEIVEQVENNELPVDSQGYAILPLGYAYLSAHNDMIRVDRSDGVLTILFYANYDSPEQFTGYIYRSDNSPPPSSIFNVQWRFLNQRKVNWYSAVSYPQVGD